MFNLLIGGELVAGARYTDVINPATETVIAQCPRASLDQLNDAVAAARQAFPTWSGLPRSERARYLFALADEVDREAKPLAELLTEEQGKPRAEAEAEIAYTAIFIRHFASLEIANDIIPDPSGSKIEVIRRPLGVVGAICAWNFPILLIAFKLPPALMAGNTIILKPAPTTSLCSLRFAEIMARVLPPGVANMVADENEIGAAITAHPGIDKISFTGSTKTGKMVMSGAAASLKRLTLELGGNDAAIVLDDVDTRQVSKKIFDAAFMNAGQVCLAIKRVYAHTEVYDAICSELAALADQTIVDDGAKQGTQIGPVQNRMQFEKLKALIDKTKKHGNIIAGGDVLDRSGFFIPPTIVRDIEDGTELVDEEQFGPILPIIRFTNESEIVDRVNTSSYGLGASVWSSDEARAVAIGRKLEAGTVWINKHLDFGPHIPLCGAKQSGVGVELGIEGLKEFTQIQVINS